MKFQTIFVFTFLLVFLAAHSAEAFYRDQVERDSFVAADNQTAVYGLSVPMGPFKEDIYIPVVGQRGLENGTRSNYFGYDFESAYPSLAVTDDGQATVLAVSLASIENGLYKIPAGTRMTVQFIGIFSVTADDSNTYAMRINEFPFFYGASKDPQSFNPSELKYLATNHEALNFTRDPE